MDNGKYAEREIELSKNILANDPDNQKQKDRCAFWLAYLGRFEEADQIQVSDKIAQIINERRNNLPV